MNILRFFLVTFLITLFSFLNGQGDVTVHTDKPYYVAGEVIWYKLYLPDAFAQVEASFKMIVSDASGDKVDDYFINNSGSQIVGYYRIPFGSKSGIYDFTLAGLNMTNMSQDLISQFNVPVYNDLEKLELNTNAIVQNGSMGQNELTIRLNKSEYAPGESVQIGLVSSQDRIVDYSISVVDEGMIGADFISNSVSTSQALSIDASQNKYQKGLYVRGKVMNEDGSPKKMNQLGVFDGATNTMHLARSNQAGDFVLTFPELHGERGFQFAGYISNEAQNVNVDVVSDDLRPSGSALVVNEKIIEYLELSRVRKKIYQYYGALEYDLTKTPKKAKKFEIKPDKTYDISKYVQFKNIGAFFNEIISSPLKFEIDGENVKALMFDAEGFKKRNALGSTENFIFDPIFIVNGKLTRDASYIYKLPLDEITTVDLYTSRKTLAKMVGNFRNYGIAIINTSNPKLTVPVKDQMKIKRMTGIQEVATFDGMKSVNKEMPQLRSSVYWNPSISNGAGIGTPLSFKGSDDVSTFNITIVAKTESGAILKGSTSYTTSLKGS